MATFTIGEAMGFKLAEELKKNLIAELRRTKSIATGNLLNSIQFDVKSTSNGLYVTMMSNEYIVYVDKGRRPGKYAPVKALEKWVRAKGLASGKKEVTSLAFAINNKIKKEGIRPKRVVETALSKSLPLFDSIIRTTVEKDLQKYLTDQLNKK